MSPPIVANGNGNQNISADLIEIVDSTTNQVVSGQTVKVVAGRRLKFTARFRSPAVSLDDLKWTIEGRNAGSRGFSDHGVATSPADLTNAELVFYFTGGTKGAIKVQATARLGIPEGGHRAAEASVQFEVDSPQLDHLTAKFTPLVQASSGDVSTTVDLDAKYVPPPSSRGAWTYSLHHHMHTGYKLDGEDAVYSVTEREVYAMKGVPVDVLVSRIPPGKQLRVKTTRTFYYYAREDAKLTDDAPETIGLSVGRVICAFVAAFEPHGDTLGFGWKMTTSYCEPDGEAAGFATSDCDN